MALIAPRIRDLHLIGLRNHAETHIAADEAPFVVLTGPNGAGKTAVLEAVSLLAPGRGLRAASLSEMAMRSGDGGFAVRAGVALEPGVPPVAIATGTTSASPERRQLRVNGAPAALTALPEWLSVLWLTPAMDRIFEDAPAARRRLLDRLTLALAPAHGAHAARFEAAMRERLRLLTGDRPADPGWLDAVEDQAARHGAEVAAARARTVALLDRALARAADPAFPAARVALSGPEWQEEGALRQALAAARGRDAAAGRATCGPHRTDLAVTLSATGVPAGRASTGEQKALLAGLMLAHAALVAEARGRVPLLLFDEVAAHLDAARRRALLERLAALGGQSWLTGQEEAPFSDLPAAAVRTRLSGGRVVEAA